MGITRAAHSAAAKKAARTRKRNTKLKAESRKKAARRRNRVSNGKSTRKSSLHKRKINTVRRSPI